MQIVISQRETVQRGLIPKHSQARSPLSCAELTEARAAASACSFGKKWILPTPLGGARIKAWKRFVQREKQRRQPEGTQ